MHAPSYLVERIKREINFEILEEAFAPIRYNPTDKYHYRDRQTPVAIDSVIRKVIVEGWVMTDINLNSGVEMYIPLRGLPREIIDPWNIVFRIPKTLTDGRSITSVYSVSFSQSYSMNSYRSNMNLSSPLLDAANGVLQSHMPLPAVSTANVTLLEENTVLINDINILPVDLYLRCMIGHEPDFKNVQKPYWVHLAELCVLATKSYCYNKLLIPMDEGVIRSGATIGRFREVVDGYADAITLYKEYLDTRWRKANALQDPEKRRRQWQWTVGGRR